jgi:hypothetical protein
LSKRYHSPAAAEEAFYQTFRELDSTGMQEVWVNSPEAYCIHPSGQLFRGWESIVSSWADIFHDAVKPNIHYMRINRSQHAKLAIHLVVERIGSTNAMSRTGAEVFATNVYQLTPQGWRMFGHHAAQAHSKPIGPKGNLKLH